MKKISKTIIFDSLQHYIYDIKLPEQKYEDDTLVDVEVTQKYATFLTQGGKVWMLGNVNSDQETQKEDVMEITPCQITSLPRISQLSCGKYHAFFLSTQGHLYSYGQDRYNCGILGLHETKSVKSPQLIQTFTSERIIQVSTSDKHAIAINDHGNAFVWGSNQSGQLGLENTKKATYPQYLGLIEVYTNKKIIACPSQSVFITKGEKLFVIGQKINFGKKSSQERQYAMLSVQQIIPQANKDTFFADYIYIDENLWASLTAHGELYIINKWFQCLLVSGNYKLEQISASKNAIYGLTTSDELLEWDILAFKKLPFIQNQNSFPTKLSPPNIYQLNQKLESAQFVNNKNSRKAAITYKIKKSKASRRKNSGSAPPLSSSCLFDGFIPQEHSGCKNLLDSYFRNSHIANRSPSPDGSYVFDYDFPSRNNILNQSNDASFNKSPLRESPSRAGFRRFSPNKQFFSQLNSRSSSKNNEEMRFNYMPSNKKGQVNLVNTNQGIVGQFFNPQQSNSKSNVKPSTYLFGNLFSESVSRKFSIDSAISNIPKTSQKPLSFHQNNALSKNNPSQDFFQNNIKESYNQQLNCVFGDNISRNSSNQQRTNEGILRIQNILKNTPQKGRSPSQKQKQQTLPQISSYQDDNKINKNNFLDEQFNQQFEYNLEKIKQLSSAQKKGNNGGNEQSRGRQLKRNNNFMEKWNQLKTKSQNQSPILSLKNSQEKQNNNKFQFLNDILNENSEGIKRRQPSAFNSNILPNDILQEMREVQNELKELENFENNHGNNRNQTPSQERFQNNNPDSFLFPGTRGVSLSNSQNLNNSSFYNQINQLGGQTNQRLAASQPIQHINDIDGYIKKSQNDIDQIHRQQIAFEEQLEREGSPNRVIRIFSDDEQNGEDNDESLLHSKARYMIQGGIELLNKQGKRSPKDDQKIEEIKDQISQLLNNLQPFNNSDNSGSNNPSSRVSTSRRGTNAPYQSINNSPSFGQSRQNSQNQRMQQEKINRIRDKINQIQKLKNAPQEQLGVNQLINPNNYLQYNKNKNRSNYAESTTYRDEEKEFDMSSLKHPSLIESPNSSNFLSPQGTNSPQPYFMSQKFQNTNFNINNSQKNDQKRPNELTQKNSSMHNSSYLKQSLGENYMNQEEEILEEPLDTIVSLKERRDTVEPDLQTIQYKGDKNKNTYPNSQYLQFVSRKGSFQDGAPVHQLMSQEEIRQQQQQQQIMQQNMTNSSINVGAIIGGGYPNEEQFNETHNSMQDPRMGQIENYGKQSSFWSDIEKPLESQNKKEFKKILDEDISGFNQDNITDKTAEIMIQGIGGNASSGNIPYGNNTGFSKNHGSQNFDENSAVNNNFGYSRNEQHKLSLQPNSFIKNTYLGDQEDQDYSGNRTSFEDNSNNAKGMQSSFLQIKQGQIPLNIQSTQYQTQISSFPISSQGESNLGSSSNTGFNLRQAFTQFLNSDNPDSTSDPAPRKIEKKIEELKNKLKSSTPVANRNKSSSQQNQAANVANSQLTEQELQSQSIQKENSNEPTKQIQSSGEDKEQENSSDHRKEEQVKTENNQKIQENSNTKLIPQLTDDINDISSSANKEASQEVSFQQKLNPFQVSGINPLYLSGENLNSDRNHHFIQNQNQRELFRDEEDNQNLANSLNDNSSVNIPNKSQDMPLKSTNQQIYEKYQEKSQVNPLRYQDEHEDEEVKKTTNIKQEQELERQTQQEQLLLKQLQEQELLKQQQEQEILKQQQQEQELIKQLQEQEQLIQVNKKQQKCASLALKLDKLVLKRVYYSFKRLCDHQNEQKLKQEEIKKEERRLVKQREQANNIFRKLQQISKLRKQEALQQIQKLAQNKDYRNKQFLRILENVIKQFKQRQYFEFFVNCQQSKVYIRGQYVNALQKNGDQLDKIVQRHLQKRFLLRWKKNTKSLGLLLKQIQLNKNIFNLTLNNFSKILKTKTITRLNQAFAKLILYSEMVESQRLQYEQQILLERQQEEIQKLESANQQNKNTNNEFELELEPEFEFAKNREELLNEKEEKIQGDLFNQNDDLTEYQNNQQTLQTAPFTSVEDRQREKYEEKVQDEQEYKLDSEYYNQKQDVSDNRSDKIKQQVNQANTVISNLPANQNENNNLLKQQIGDDNNKEINSQGSFNILTEDKSGNNSQIYDVSNTSGSKNHLDQEDQDSIKNQDQYQSNSIMQSDDDQQNLQNYSADDIEQKDENEPGKKSKKQNQKQQNDEQDRSQEHNSDQSNQDKLPKIIIGDQIITFQDNQKKSFLNQEEQKQDQDKHDQSQHNSEQLETQGNQNNLNTQQITAADEESQQTQKQSDQQNEILNTSNPSSIENEQELQSPKQQLQLSDQEIEGINKQQKQYESKNELNDKNLTNLEQNQSQQFQEQQEENTLRQEQKLQNEDEQDLKGFATNQQSNFQVDLNNNQQQKQGLKNQSSQENIHQDLQNNQLFKELQQKQESQQLQAKPNADNNISQHSLNNSGLQEVDKSLDNQNQASCRSVKWDEFSDYKEDQSDLSRNQIDSRQVLNEGQLKTLGVKNEEEQKQNSNKNPSDQNLNSQIEDLNEQNNNSQILKDFQDTSNGQNRQEILSEVQDSSQIKTEQNNNDNSNNQITQKLNSEEQIILQSQQKQEQGEEQQQSDILQTKNISEDLHSVQNQGMVQQLKNEESINQIKQDKCFKFNQNENNNQDLQISNLKEQKYQDAAKQSQEQGSSLTEIQQQKENQTQQEGQEQNDEQIADKHQKDQQLTDNKIEAEVKQQQEENVKIMNQQNKQLQEIKDQNQNVLQQNKEQEQIQINQAMNQQSQSQDLEQIKKQNVDQQIKNNDNQEDQNNLSKQNNQEQQNLQFQHENKEDDEFQQIDELYVKENQQPQQNQEKEEIDQDKSNKFEQIQKQQDNQGLNEQIKQDISSCEQIQQQQQNLSAELKERNEELKERNEELNQKQVQQSDHNQNDENQSVKSEQIESDEQLEEKIDSQNIIGQEELQKKPKDLNSGAIKEKDQNGQNSYSLNNQIKELNDDKEQSQKQEYQEPQIVRSNQSISSGSLSPQREFLENDSNIQQIDQINHTSDDTCNITGDMKLTQQSVSQAQFSNNRIPSFNSVDNQTFKDIEEQPEQKNERISGNRVESPESQKFQTAKSDEAFYSIKSNDLQNQYSSNEYYTAEGAPLEQRKSSSSFSSQTMIRNVDVQDSRNELEQIEEENPTPNHSNIGSRIFGSPKQQSSQVSQQQLGSQVEIILSQNKEGDITSRDLPSNISSQQASPSNKNDQVLNFQKNLLGSSQSLPPHFVPETSEDDLKLLDSELRDQVLDNLVTNIDYIKQKSQLNQNQKDGSAEQQATVMSLHPYQLAQSFLSQESQTLEQSANDLNDTKNNENKIIQDEEKIFNQQKQENQVDAEQNSTENKQNGKKFDTLMQQMQEQEKIFNDQEIIKFTEENEEASIGQSIQSQLQQSTNSIQNSNIAQDDKASFPIVDESNNKHDKQNENDNLNRYSSFFTQSSSQNPERQKEIFDAQNEIAQILEISKITNSDELLEKQINLSESQIKYAKEWLQNNPQKTVEEYIDEVVKRRQSEEQQEKQENKDQSSNETEEINKQIENSEQNDQEDDWLNLSKKKKSSDDRFQQQEQQQMSFEKYQKLHQSDSNQTPKNQILQGFISPQIEGQVAQFESQISEKIQKEQIIQEENIQDNDLRNQSKKIHDLLENNGFKFEEMLLNQSQEGETIPLDQQVIFSKKPLHQQLNQQQSDEKQQKEYEDEILTQSSHQEKECISSNESSDKMQDMFQQDEQEQLSDQRFQINDAKDYLNDLYGFISVPQSQEKQSKKKKLQKKLADKYQPKDLCKLIEQSQEFTLQSQEITIQSSQEDLNQKIIKSKRKSNYQYSESDEERDQESSLRKINQEPEESFSSNYSRKHQKKHYDEDLFKHSDKQQDYSSGKKSKSNKSIASISKSEVAIYLNEIFQNCKFSKVECEDSEEEKIKNMEIKSNNTNSESDSDEQNQENKGKINASQNLPKSESKQKIASITSMDKLEANNYLQNVYENCKLSQLLISEAEDNEQIENEQQILNQEQNDKSLEKQQDKNSNLSKSISLFNKLEEDNQQVLNQENKIQEDQTSNNIINEQFNATSSQQNKETIQESIYDQSENKQATNSSKSLEEQLLNDGQSNIPCNNSTILNQSKSLKIQNQTTNQINEQLEQECDQKQIRDNQNQDQPQKIDQKLDFNDLLLQGQLDQNKSENQKEIETSNLEFNQEQRQVIVDQNENKLQLDKNFKQYQGFSQQKEKDSNTIDDQHSSQANECEIINKSINQELQDEENIQKNKNLKNETNIQQDLKHNSSSSTPSINKLNIDGYKNDVYKNCKVSQLELELQQQNTELSENQLDEEEAKVQNNLNQGSSLNQIDANSYINEIYKNSKLSQIELEQLQQNNQIFNNLLSEVAQVQNNLNQGSSFYQLDAENQLNEIYKNSNLSQLSLKKLPNSQMSMNQLDEQAKSVNNLNQDPSFNQLDAESYINEIYKNSKVSQIDLGQQPNIQISCNQQDEQARVDNNQIQDTSFNQLDAENLVNEICKNSKLSQLDIGQQLIRQLSLNQLDEETKEKNNLNQNSSFNQIDADKYINKIYKNSKLSQLDIGQQSISQLSRNQLDEETKDKNNLNQNSSFNQIDADKYINEINKNIKLSQIQLGQDDDIQKIKEEQIENLKHLHVEEQVSNQKEEASSDLAVEKQSNDNQNDDQKQSLKQQFGRLTLNKYMEQSSVELQLPLRPSFSNPEITSQFKQQINYENLDQQLDSKVEEINNLDQIVDRYDSTLKSQTAKENDLTSLNNQLAGGYVSIKDQQKEINHLSTGSMNQRKQFEIIPISSAKQNNSEDQLKVQDLNQDNSDKILNYSYQQQQLENNLPQQLEQINLQSKQNNSEQNQQYVDQANITNNLNENSQKNSFSIQINSSKEYQNNVVQQPQDAIDQILQKFSSLKPLNNQESIQQSPFINNDQRQLNSKPVDKIDEILNKFKNDNPQDVFIQRLNEIVQQNNSNSDIQGQREQKAIGQKDPIDSILQKYQGSALLDNKINSPDNQIKNNHQTNIEELMKKYDINQVVQSENQYPHTSEQKLLSNQEEQQPIKQDQINRLQQKYTSQDSQINEQQLKIEEPDVKDKYDIIDLILQKHKSSQQLNNSFYKQSPEKQIDQQDNLYNQAYPSIIQRQSDTIDDLIKKHKALNNNPETKKSQEISFNPSNNVFDPTILIADKPQSQGLLNSEQNQQIYSIDRIKDLANQDIKNQSNLLYTFDNEGQGYDPEKQYKNLRKTEQNVNSRISNNFQQELDFINQNKTEKISESDLKRGKSAEKEQNQIIAQTNYAEKHQQYLDQFDNKKVDIQGLIYSNTPEAIQTNLAILKESYSGKEKEGLKFIKPQVVQILEEKINDHLQNKSIIDSFAQRQMLQQQIYGIPPQEQVTVNKYYKLSPKYSAQSPTNLFQQQLAQSINSPVSQNSTPKDELKIQQAHSYGDQQQIQNNSEVIDRIIQGARQLSPITGQLNVMLESERNNRTNFDSNYLNQSSSSVVISRELSQPNSFRPKEQETSKFNQLANNQKQMQIKPVVSQDNYDKQTGTLSQKASKDLNKIDKDLSKSYPKPLNDSLQKDSQINQFNLPFIQNTFYNQTNKGSANNSFIGNSQFDYQTENLPQNALNSNVQRNNESNVGISNKLQTFGNSNEPDQNNTLSHIGIDDYKPILFRSQTGLDNQNRDDSENPVQKQVSLNNSYQILQDSSYLPVSSTHFGVNSNNNTMAFPVSGFTTPANSTFVNLQSNTLLPKSTQNDLNQDFKKQKSSNKQNTINDEEEQEVEEEEERKEMPSNTNQQSEGYHTRYNSYGSSIPFEIKKPQPSRDQSLESFKNSDILRGSSPLRKYDQQNFLSPKIRAEFLQGQLNPNTKIYNKDNTQDYLGSEHMLENELNNSQNFPNSSFISNGNVDFLIRPQSQFPNQYIQSPFQEAVPAQSQQQYPNFLDNLHSINQSRDSSFTANFQGQPHFYSQTSSPAKIHSGNQLAYQSATIQQAQSVHQSSVQTFHPNQYPHSAHHSPYASRSEFKPVIQQTIIKQQIVSKSTSQILYQSHNSLSSIDSQVNNQIRHSNQASLPPQHPGSMQKLHLTSPVRQTHKISHSQSNINSSIVINSPAFVTKTLHHSNSQTVIPSQLQHSQQLNNSQPFIKITQLSPVKQVSVIHHNHSNSQISIASVNDIQIVQNLNDSVHSSNSAIQIFNPSQIGQEVQKATTKNVIINPHPVSKTVVQHIVDSNNQLVQTNIISQKTPQISKTPAILCQKDQLPSPEKPIKSQLSNSFSQVNLDQSVRVQMTPASLNRIGSSQTLSTSQLPPISQQVSKTPIVINRTLYQKDIPKI
ncbi:hypothetical protein ABPG72_012797 [Tetrahymena utriculariae]